MSAPLRVLHDPRPDRVPGDVESFLRAIGGAAAIRVRGRDRSRTRVVATLLHGNEPSGVRAVHAWLRGGRQAAVDALFLLGNVAAALHPPAFTRRSLPGRRDLNRCFLGPFDDAEGGVAWALLAAIEQARPEALVDVHNNTGHNPPYGVGVEPTAAVLQLTALFGERFVWSDLRIGALIEAVRDVPSVTLEVGRSGDPGADAVALRGIGAFLERDSLLSSGETPALDLLVSPMRATLRPGIRVAVADAPVAGAELTVLTDLDRHNFEQLAAGMPIGWVSEAALPLELRGAEGRDRASEYFHVEQGRLLARRSFVPIMITTDPGIARSDCLFYVVNRLRGGSVTAGG